MDLNINPIIRFIESGGNFISIEGKKLLLESEISVIGESILDSNNVFNEFEKAVKDHNEINSADGFALTSKAKDVVHFVEIEYLRRKRLGFIKAYSSS